MSWHRAQSCAHISSAVAGVRSSAAGACAGSAGAARGAAHRQLGRQGAALCAATTATWLWDCGRRTRAPGYLRPVQAGLLHPSLGAVAARLLVFAGQGRGDCLPLTALTCLAALPMRMCVLEQ